jgi:hypothetical protein
MRFLQTWLAAVVLLQLSPAGILIAQDPGAPAAPLPGPRVLPGDSTLRGDRVRAGTSTYLLTTVREGLEQTLGTITDVITLETDGAVPVIRRVHTARRGAVALVDSSVTDARTLAPRSHRSVQPTRRISLEFNRKRVKGSLAPAETPSLPIDTAFATAPFDSANWDLLVRSLPLAKDYAAWFPVYDVDGGLHHYHVQVTGAATMLGEVSYIVRFSLSRSRAATVWIGKQSGLVLQIETLLGPMLLRQELQREPPREPRQPLRQ